MRALEREQFAVKVRFGYITQKIRCEKMKSKGIYEIRVDNLLRLIKQYTTQEELQRLTGIASSSFSRIKNWTPEIQNQSYKRMGEKLARRIEASLELPDFWMDTNQDELAPGVAATAPPRAKAKIALAPVRDVLGLSPIQTATCDTIVKLMIAGKLPDTACLKLLQTWQSAVEELEASA